MQNEFNFRPTPLSHDPVEVWRDGLRRQQIACAKALLLPVGSQVEVWLKGGIFLKGRLEFQEEMLLRADLDLENPKLRIGRTPFCRADLESCVRVD
jgi:hypothetical protein